jgi:hypothetical protein
MPNGKKDRRIVFIRSAVFFLFYAALSAAIGCAGSGKAVQDRLDADIAAGRPVIIHVVVALCDNDNQGIVPVSRILGNGRDPDKNLYWGAVYGVRTYLTRVAGWEKIASIKPENNRILDRIVLHSRMERGEKSADLYLVADACNGARIREAIQSFLQMAAGYSTEKISVLRGSVKEELAAGGSAHLVSYVGHDGLMDFSLPKVRASAENRAARSAIVLACASEDYFPDHLQTADAHALLLTTGLMAPEAYTLDAAIRAWIEKGNAAAVTEASAAAYHRYQKCGLKAARRLFRGDP